MGFATRGRLGSFRKSEDTEDEPVKLTRQRSQSRGGARFGRSRSKSRSRFDVRDAPEQAVNEEVNKFVQFKKFGLYATEISRVIAIDEIPDVEHSHQVVVKVKVRDLDEVAVLSIDLSIRRRIPFKQKR